MTNSKIIVGDCLKVLPCLEGVDVVATSPPYNLGIDYKSYNDKKPRDEYLSWLRDIFSQLKNVMKDDGSFFLNMGFSCIDPWLAIDVANVARDLFVLQNQICWIKSITIDDRTRGHFKPIFSKRFINNNFELIFHFTKNGDVEVDRLSIGVPYEDKTNIDRWKDVDNLHCRGNCWFIPYETVVRTATYGFGTGESATTNWITVTEAANVAGVNKGIISGAVADGTLLGNGLTGRERRISAEDLERWLYDRANPQKKEHPAIFPISLVQNCVKLHGPKTKLVLDPFLGTGTTLVACDAMGINSIGIEIDEDYAKLAKKRLPNASLEIFGQV